MRPHMDIAHQGNLGTDDRTRMSISNDDISHIMSILIDLYTDRPLAVIREYSTNAYDAHRDAGHSDPIHIISPTRMLPIFKVIDHGIGMSVDDIFDIYSQYGRSTKRDSDEAVGMLGLGCKSALTYTSQFTLVTRKNGVQATVLVTREDDGAGAVQVVDTCQTTLRNGVEVHIPVKDVEHFNNKIGYFFQFWEEGTVLVDGQPPKPFKSSMVLDPDVMLSRDLDTDYVIMGNVAYPIHAPVPGLCPPRQDGMKTGTHAVVRVPIGAVNFTPSREALHLTKRTEETLHDIRTFIAHRTSAEAQKDIDAAPTFADALDRALKWRQTFRGTYTYKGQDIPWGNFIFAGGHGYIHRGTYHQQKAEKSGYCTIDAARKSLIVYGFTANGVSRGLKDKAEHYIRENNLDFRQVIFTAADVFTPWIDPKQVVRYDDIRKIVLPGTEQTERKSRAGAYRVLNLNGFLSYQDHAPEKMVWLAAARQVDRASLAMSVKNIDQDVSIVVVDKNRLPKFKREHSDVPSVQYFIATKVREVYKTITMDEWWMNQHSYEINDIGLEHVDPNRCFDPSIGTVVRRIKAVDRSKIQEYSRLTGLCHNLGVSFPQPPRLEGHDLRSVIAEVVREYPMIDEIKQYSRNRRHYRRLNLAADNETADVVYEYLNSLYIVRHCVSVALNPVNPTA